MSAEEEKNQPDQQSGAEPSAEERELTADPLAGAEAAAEAEPEARETGAEKKEKKLWPAALALMLLVLAGGGYYALTGLDDTAHKLGGGEDYDRLSANSDVYDGTAGQAARSGDFFPLDEEGARKAAYKAADGDAKQDRMNPAVVSAKGELAAGASASGSGSGGVVLSGAADESGDQEGRGAAGPQSAGMAEKLRSKGYSASGPGGSRSKGQSAGGNTAAFEGSGALAGRASVQRETNQAKARQGAKGGVMDSLKGAFRATFYGARLSSQDAARSWVSRAFDASPEHGTAIEYDEKMRSKLDRVNPDSIPSFLRDQDVTAAEAKRLATAEPGKPKLDKEGTYEALKNDSNYQRQKLASDFGNSMLNGMFAGISGTGGGGGNQPDPEVFSDPEDQATLNSLGLGEFLESQGNGEECGCTAGAPCCCLPQDYFASQDQGGNCPMYGPFLPNDPCGASFNTGNAGLSGSVVTGPQ